MACGRGTNHGAGCCPGAALLLLISARQAAQCVAVINLLSAWLYPPQQSRCPAALAPTPHMIIICRYVDPRPAVKAYYGRVQQRPSWGKAFGPALSGLTTARLLLPALLKAWWAGITGRY